MTTKTIDPVPKPRTTKDPRSDGHSVTTIELPITHKTQPGLGVGPPAHVPDLETRIKAHRAALLAKLVQLRAHKRLIATEAAHKLRANLSELAHIIKEGVVDGWGSLTDPVKHKLERWLADSARPLPAETVPAGTGRR